jgi:phage recombination protein Bet
MAKAGAVAARETGMVIYQSRSGDEVQLSLETVKNFLVTGNKDLVTVQEMVYFMGICKARGLNPFAKDCYLVKYTANESAAIITGIDFYRSRARAMPDCVGWERGVIVQKKDGELRYSKGLVLEDEKVVGGYFKAKPTGWTEPFELEVNLSDYIKTTREGNVTAFWKKAAMMISKVAESQGLRILWPDEFRGTISAEEAGFQSDQFGEPIDITPHATEPPAGKSAPESPPQVDLGQYNALVKNKKISPERIKHLDEFLKQTAASQKKAKLTVDQLKEKAAANFDGFFGAFEKWEGVTYPAPVNEPPVQEPPQEEPPEDVPQGEAGPAEKAEEESGPGQVTDEDWPAAQDPVVIPFAERAQKVWHEIIGKGIPLSNLKLEDGSTIQRMAEITDKNIDEVIKIVQDYKPPRGKK